MPVIRFIEASGAEHCVDVDAGLSLMEGATRNGVPGILADCGGTCACGTCRVYVDAIWRRAAGEPSDIEAETIDAHEEPAAGTRLACQVTVTDALDGLTVRLPASQF